MYTTYMYLLLHENGCNICDLVGHGNKGNNSIVAAEDVVCKNIVNPELTSVAWQFLEECVEQSLPPGAAL